MIKVKPVDSWFEDFLIQYGDRKELAYIEVPIVGLPCNWRCGSVAADEMLSIDTHDEFGEEERLADAWYASAFLALREHEELEAAL